MKRTGEACKIIGVHPNTLRKYIKNGELKSKIIGGQFRIHIKDINKFLDERMVEIAKQ